MRTKIIALLGIIIALALCTHLYKQNTVAQQFTKENLALAVASTSSSSKALTDAQVIALADNKYADGNVPLGDYKYVTDAPKKGYMYLCHARKDNPGSMVNGPWIKNDTVWNFLEKITVDGNVTWKEAVFKNTISGAYRVLTGNNLPINHTTGIFPVSRNSAAGKYDPNPNTISAQNMNRSIAANPTYSDTPFCMGGEVGVMLTGVPLFNGFDAGLRDAPAHELQDSCDGHPQGDGQYHYHSQSSCLKDADYKTVVGFAYDGFPITGGNVAKNKYLTTEDLDECHGITSEIIVDGKKKITYHYVLTKDFPYSASCFRSKPISTGPEAGGGTQQPPRGPELRGRMER